MPLLSLPCPSQGFPFQEIGARVKALSKLDQARAAFRTHALPQAPMEEGAAIQVCACLSPFQLEQKTCLLFDLVERM